MTEKRIEDTKLFSFIGRIFDAFCGLKTFGFKGYFNLWKLSKPFRKSQDWGK